MQTLKILGLIALTPLLAFAQFSGLGDYDSLSTGPGIPGVERVGPFSTGVSAVTPGIVPDGKSVIRADSIATSIVRTPLPRRDARSRCPSRGGPSVLSRPLGQPRATPAIESPAQAPADVR